MCDYCDCRRIPEIARLGAEHEVIQELADKALAVAKSGAGSVSEAVRDLLDVLEPHVAGEEAGVFTQARLAGLAGYYVDDLEDDHRRFEGVLAKPRLDTTELEQFVDDLHRHIAIEEYDLFPAAAQTLTEDQWEVVDSKRAAEATV